MSQAAPRKVHVIDSHTGGEPTRIVVAGGPDLGGGDMHQRRAVLQRDHDRFRSAVVNEPRGSDVLVGGMICDPADQSCAAGIIFFNNVGYLNMCGHGTIGLAVTLAYLGRIAPGRHRIETPVGIVSVSLEDANTATIENVPSYRYRKSVTVDVAGIGPVVGDIAWGGNWFFLVENPPERLTIENVARLSEFATRVKHSLRDHGIRGEDGGEIDHVELCGPPLDSGNDGRNFVLCPGEAYDRSPCGTGTSAKVACLLEDRKIDEGQVWRQEGILGTVFEASGTRSGRHTIPRVRGTAYVNADATLLIDPNDPFAWGIRA